MKEVVPQREGISQNLLIGIGGATAVVAVCLLIYFLRASDPAARGPIPYTKFDYGAHMQEQTRDFNRQPRSAAGSAPAASSATH